MQNNPTPHKQKKSTRREDFDDYYFDKNVIICDDRGQKITAKVYETSKYWLMLKTSDRKTIFMNKAFIKSIELAEEK